MGRPPFPPQFLLLLDPPQSLLLPPPQIRLGILGLWLLGPDHGAGDQAEFRPAVDQYGGDWTVRFCIPATHHVHVVALPRLSPQEFGMLLVKVLLEERLVLEQFAAEVEGAPRPSVPVDYGVIVHPLLLGLILEEFDLLRGAVGDGIDDDVGGVVGPRGRRIGLALCHGALDGLIEAHHQHVRGGGLLFLLVVLVVDFLVLLFLLLRPRHVGQVIINAIRRAFLLGLLQYVVSPLQSQVDRPGRMSSPQRPPHRIGRGAPVVEREEMNAPQVRHAHIEHVLVSALDEEELLENVVEAYAAEYAAGRIEGSGNDDRRHPILGDAIGRRYRRGQYRDGLGGRDGRRGDEDGGPTEREAGGRLGLRRRRTRPFCPALVLDVLLLLFIAAGSALVVGFEILGGGGPALRVVINLVSAVGVGAVNVELEDLGGGVAGISAVTIGGDVRLGQVGDHLVPGRLGPEHGPRRPVQRILPAGRVSGTSLQLVVGRRGSSPPSAGSVLHGARHGSAEDRPYSPLLGTVAVLPQREAELLVGHVGRNVHHLEQRPPPDRCVKMRGRDGIESPVSLEELVEVGPPGGVMRRGFVRGVLALSGSVGVGSPRAGVRPGLARPLAGKAGAPRGLDSVSQPRTPHEVAHVPLVAVPPSALPERPEALLDILHQSRCLLGGSFPLRHRRATLLEGRVSGPEPRIVNVGVEVGADVP
mmetsp:Transcript_41624/g.126206  ORF Transcript_41624/g.126206 Transcript_41624/m.126206 type:complete len:699 (-) Transcript_41624:1108-3204(-)